MPKKRTPEAKLAEAIQEMGVERAEAFFRFHKALHTTKPEPKTRIKKQRGVDLGLE